MRLLTAKRLQTIIAACAVVLALPSAAVARSGPFTAVRAAGKTQRGSFLGQITVSRFTVKKSGLAAVVLLTGTLQDARYPQVVAVREPGLTL